MLCTFDITKEFETICLKISSVWLLIWVFRAEISSLGSLPLWLKKYLYRQSGWLNRAQSRQGKEKEYTSSNGLTLARKNF